jgi:CheY-like chemotaxis protein
MPRILLIEDDEDARERIARRLMRHGYQVISAADSDEGLAMMSESPDLVVVDMNVGVPDGWEVTRRIKSDPEYGNRPVLGLIGEDTPDEQEKAMDAGCEDYLARPIHVDQLLAKVQELLAKVQ